MMAQGENDSLEYFEERFQLSYKQAHNCSVDDESFKLVLLRGVRDGNMDTLILFFL